ncbi:myosin-11-like [Bidens hawaiensis]|uniref:myosin-11-like n=1 Tax=Bidens hawaiensis TaxID=980011 RepID=UPI00404AB0AC
MADPLLHASSTNVSLNGGHSKTEKPPFLIAHEDDKNVLAYWLSNASTLLAQILPLRLEPKYHAALNFKQQLTAYVEKTYRMLRDNLIKQISPVIESCIDQVPPFLIRKIFTQIFSYLNVKLFNSLMLRLELYSIGNGEYVETGLSQLEQWCYKATEKYLGSAWYELKHIKYAIGFLVIQDKSRKTLDEISDDLCPLLNIQQLYKICTWFFDDTYRNRGVAPRVISTMKDLKEGDYLNGAIRTAFLLDDDLSIPFSVDDFSKSTDQINITNIELPPLVLEHLGLDFLLSPVDS